MVKGCLVRTHRSRYVFGFLTLEASLNAYTILQMGLIGNDRIEVFIEQLGG